jgi:hypothetical protein
MKTTPMAAAPPVILIPITPVSTPLRLKFRKRTVFRASIAAKLFKGMLMPLVPLWRIEANTSWQSMVIATHGALRHETALDAVMGPAPSEP